MGSQRCFAKSVVSVEKGRHCFDMVHSLCILPLAVTAGSTEGMFEKNLKKDTFSF